MNKPIEDMRLEETFWVYRGLGDLMGEIDQSRFYNEAQAIEFAKNFCVVTKSRIYVFRAIGYIDPMIVTTETTLFSKTQSKSG